MTNVNWLIEKCIFDNDDRYIDFLNIINEFGDTINRDGLDGPETCLSSLSRARDAGFYDKNEYKISSYMNYIPEWYLNNDCLFVPFGLLKSSIFKNKIFNNFKYTNRLFMKSDSGFKTLVGFDFKKNKYDKQVSMLNDSLSNDTMLLISSFKNIENEYRFWIIDGEIITHSSYSWDFDEEYSEPEQHIIDTAKLIARSIKLDAYTLDLCLVKNDCMPHVVEVNNIYTSGTYNCDLRKLFEGLRNMAIKEYEEFYGF